MKQYVRLIFFAIVVASAVSLSSAAFCASGKKISIIVGGADKLIYLPAILADKLGYFEDEGLDVELLDDESGVGAEDQMLTGAVQGVVGFYDHCIMLQAKGKFVVSVVQLGQTPGEVELVSNKAQGVAALADLKGMNLGVTGLGSSTHRITQYLMNKAGVKPGEYSIVPVGASSTFAAALRQDRIQAGMTTDPTASMLVEAGEAHILVDMRSIQGTTAVLGGPYPAASLYMPEEWVKKNAASVQKLVNALVRALKYIHAHSAEEIIGTMPEDYYAGRKETYIRALSDGKSMFTEDGLMPESGPDTALRVVSSVSKLVKYKNIDLSKTFYTEFARQAQMK